MLSPTTRAAVLAAIRRSLSGRASLFCWYPEESNSFDSFGKPLVEWDLFTPIFGRVSRVSVAPEDISTGADARPLFKFIGIGSGGSFVPSVGNLIASQDYREAREGLSSLGEMSTGGLFRVVRVEPVVNNPVATPVTCYVVLEDTI
jgi:hypothetical protein